MPTGPKGEKHSADAGYIRTSDGIGGASFFISQPFENPLRCVLLRQGLSG
jgi:hypothetical protein